MIKTSLFAAIAVTTPAFAELGYTFDTDTQGWGIHNDATGLTWDGSDGSPDAGFLRARDIGDGRIWYFAAPVVDLGDLSGLYGGNIDWSIIGITGNQSSFSDRADVILVGGGLSIGINVGTQPVNGQWTSWSTAVHASSDWRMMSSLSSGALSATSATQSDMLTVLSDLQGFYIQGEYTNGGDAAGIDSVVFVPTPASAALLTLAGVATCRRRR